MENRDQNKTMLDLMLRPAFCVEDGCIRYVNEAAAKYLLYPGTQISELITSGREEYAEFTDGCLYLTMQFGAESLGASVVKMEGQDIFLIEQQESLAELRAMALAAKELREPLAGVMTITDRIFPTVEAQEQTAQVNRRLFQMMRMLTNMSDAFRYCQTASGRLEYAELGSFYAEVFEKAAMLLSHAGITLRYTGIHEPVYTLADRERLERSAYNMLSNAAKFAPRDSIIEAKLSRRGSRLFLSVSNQGESIESSANVYTRFRREPALEDSRYGIGLGMVLVRSTAALHGGAVLIDQPGGFGSRTTMTLAIRQSRDTTVRSPVFRIDYAGEWDHGLLELSDCLPADLYKDI